jgi:flagellar biosynthetic protein FlhB
MAEDTGEKTEAPTQKRRKDAIDKGDILKSRELGTAVVVLAGAMWLAFAGPSLLAALQALLRDSLMFGRADVQDFQPLRPVLNAGRLLVVPLASLFGLTILAAVASQAGLGNLRFNPTLLAVKPNRMDPMKGLGRMFGKNGLIELGKALLKVALLGAIGGWLLWRSRHASLALINGSLESSLAALGSSFVLLLLVMAGGLVVIAGIDFPIQLVQHLAKLRMSHKEIRDEHKEAEGSPDVKAQQRRLQREMLKGGARAAVQGAHVVLTNPTHFAVALRYDRGRDAAPVVAIKGRGATALAIRELAAENSIPVLEYPGLARAIYYTSRNGQEIRDDLYLAVATVLAFVFGLNNRAGAMRQPDVEVPATARFDEHGNKIDRP